MPAQKSISTAIVDAVDFGLGLLEHGLTGTAHDVVSATRRHLPAALDLVSTAIELSKNDDKETARLLKAAMAAIDAAFLARRAQREAKVAKKPRRSR